MTYPELIKPRAIHSGKTDIATPLRTSSSVAGRLLQVSGLTGSRSAWRNHCVIRECSGDGDGLEACIASGWFNCLATPYNVLSGWRERHRLKTASTRGMSIVGYDAYPASLAEAAKGPKLVRSSIWRRASDPQSGAGAYSFMGKTDGWTPQEICVAYALTEPSLSTVQVDAADPKRLAALAAVPERDLPSQVPAQIEMARFSAPPGGVERRRRA